MPKFLVALVALLMSSAAMAGDFSLDREDASGLWYSYTGTVIIEDSDTLHEIMTQADGKRVFITINSGGGSAYGGLALFWEAERWRNLATIAGKDFGAWSAAAMFWMGSPHDFFEGKDAKVGFHAAYCNPWYPPGCDTSVFQDRLIEAFNKAGYIGIIFNHELNRIQKAVGVSGWLMLTDEGWFFHYSTYDLTEKIKPTWLW